MPKPSKKKSECEPAAIYLILMVVIYGIFWYYQKDDRKFASTLDKAKYAPHLEEPFDLYNATRSLQDVVADPVVPPAAATGVTEEVQTSYPNELFTNHEILNGGFLLYLLGIAYMFVGISLVSQNYINPSVDIIKTKGVFSADSMNATVLAFTNTAAESMIIMNAIFFGVSDMGISTTVSQTAFYVLII